MRNDVSYDIRSRLTSLSTKLKCLKNVPEYSSNNLSEIFFEKAKYNLPLLMAEIIRHLEFTDQSKDIFISMITEFNQDNNTKLDFYDFESICWIRIIHNEVQIPGMVEHLMWSLNDDNEKAIGTIPEERKNVSSCLLRYYKYIHNKRAKLASKNLFASLEKLKLKNDAISYLIEKSIIEYDNEQDVYFWGTQEHYPKTLNDEIAALLWILEKDETNIEASFFRYYNLLMKTHIKLNDLSDFLSADECHTLFIQSIRYLENEEDLRNSENEIMKIWFDSRSFSYKNIFSNAPIFSFNEINTYQLLRKIDQENIHLKDSFYMQQTREFCYSLLRFIIIHETKNSFFNEKKILNIIKDVSRPTLLFYLLFLIERTYPEVLPWFYIDLELSPVAMNIFHEFSLNSDYFTNDLGLYNKQEKELALKNDLWIESFDIILTNISDIWHSSVLDKQEVGKTISRIFIDLSRKIFSIYLSANSNCLLQLQGLLDVYAESIKRLQNLKINPGNFYNYQPAKQSLFPFLFWHTMVYIINSIKNTNIIERNSLVFHFHFFDVSIDFIRTLNNIYCMENISDDLKQKNDIITKEIVSLLFSNLCQYFNFEKIEKKEKNDKFRFYIDVEKFDYIDWGYFFMLLQKYDLLLKLNNNFKNGMNIDKSENKYSDNNHNQMSKATMFLRIVYIAFLSLKSTRTDLFSPEVKIENVCNILEELIVKYTVFFSLDNFDAERLDVFEYNPSIATDETGKSLLELLFCSMNLININKQTEIINGIFNNSIKLDRMLSAINKLEGKEIKDIIKDYIEKIDIERFVASCFFIDSIEEAVFQALYSEHHWDIAGSLISRIKNHYESKKILDIHANYLVYQADLLLALRMKDLKAIQSVEFKKKEYSHQEYKIDELKRFYIAIHNINNEKNYSDAVKILNDLLSSDPKNTGYGIALFSAYVFNALNQPEIDINQINIDYTNWTNFLNNLGDKKENFIAKNKTEINFYSIPYFIVNEKDTEFDIAIANMSDDYKFNELVLKMIINYYFKRNQRQDAYNYATEALNFFAKNKKEIPKDISDILPEFDSYLLNLETSFNAIVNCHYTNIPKIVPDKINNKKELNKFILTEIINSLKQMLVKIQTINKLNYEDNYTDILHSILKLRFPFYGWSICDHSHHGISLKGIGSGEPDLIIESASVPITIIEALIIEGKDKTKIHNHVNKCFKYSSFLNRYYIVIYFKGEKSNFDITWESYKEDFNLISFPEGKKPSGGFIELNDEFDGIENFKIAKTCHTKIEMFHIMVNFVV